mgnify:CR=1 FL=1
MVQEQIGEQTLGTLVDGEFDAGASVETTLVYIGSPVNGFGGAGQRFSLMGVTGVRFVRAEGSTLEAEARPLSGSTARELEIAVPLQWVSAMHARLSIRGDSQFHLVDCGSRNGTFVEGHRIRRVTPVSDGDLIEVGRSFWMLRSQRVAAESGIVETSNPVLGGTARALARLAASEVPIVLLGETGVGKTELAAAIHRASGRMGPLVQVHVMVESARTRLLTELAERARGGTLLLEDVGELCPRGQAELLAALMARVTAEQIRIVATSTRDLRQMVDTQTFRPDLYARLAGYEAKLPPLRDRREDLGQLVHRLARLDSGKSVEIETDVFRDMLGHDWPFNLRELKHAVESALALTGEITSTESARIDMKIWDRVVWRASDLPSPARIAAVRHELVQQLSTHAGNTSAVAASLRCEISDIERWLHRFSIEPTRYAPPP